MDDQAPHTPTRDELVGDTWEYCYGQDVVSYPPQPKEHEHEHHQ